MYLLYFIEINHSNRLFSLLCEKYILSFEAPTERQSEFGPRRCSVTLTGGIAEQETAFMIILGIKVIPTAPHLTG